MYAQLNDALTRYKAIAAAGVMMDIKTGEIVGMVSLPDFDPNAPSTLFQDYNGQKNQRFNRITSGIYELGSTFKTVTMAAALDAHAVKITDQFDARYGVKFGRFTIDDFHGKHRILSLPEVYKYSSNIGTIHVMQALGRTISAISDAGRLRQAVPFELPECVRRTCRRNSPKSSRPPRASGTAYPSRRAPHGAGDGGVHE